MQKKTFQHTVWKHYKENPRPMPWRTPWIKLRKDGTVDPYKILVSEIMLQQTQVSRVIPKYKSFLKKFPSFKSLANANLSDVLIEWQGLGYNRRAKNLKATAEIITNESRGKFPTDLDSIMNLPGIGQSTVGAIMAYAFNTGIPFIETNIRAVYIHFFFKNHGQIHDKELLPLIEKTIDHSNPREWFYALMDYGVMLKATIKDPARKSQHYKKQSSFKGSRREKRSLILKYILKHSSATLSDLRKHIDVEGHNLKEIADELAAELLVNKVKQTYKKI